MRVAGTGHLLFALGLAGLGVLSLVSSDFPYTWEPVPTWVPWREILAQLSGAILLAGGIGLLIKRIASPAAFALAIFLLGWVLVLQAPRAAQAPANVGMWLGVAESTLLFTGGWILFAFLATPRMRIRVAYLTSDRGLHLARICFGVACLLFGLSHFVYGPGTASMIPAWLPAHLGLAYFTGACHFAAGLAILFAVLPRLAATMEACMISLFVVLIHIPGAIREPASRMQWTMVSVATALAGAVWIISSSLRETSWGWSRTSVEHPTLTVVRPPGQI
jgi:uncharacterized membrane protein